MYSENINPCGCNRGRAYGMINPYYEEHCLREVDRNYLFPVEAICMTEDHYPIAVYAQNTDAPAYKAKIYFDEQSVKNLVKCYVDVKQTEFYSDEPITAEEEEMCDAIVTGKYSKKSRHEKLYAGDPRYNDYTCVIENTSFMRQFKPGPHLNRMVGDEISRMTDDKVNKVFRGKRGGETVTTAYSTRAWNKFAKAYRENLLSEEVMDMLDSRRIDKA